MSKGHFYLSYNSEPTDIKPELIDTSAQQKPPEPLALEGRQCARFRSFADIKPKRKSRWADDKSFVPGMPTMLPQELTEQQLTAYRRTFAFS